MCYNILNKRGRERERDHHMGYINDDNVQFSGREAKAMAKFCGKNGHVLCCNGGIYLLDEQRISIARIRLVETQGVAVYANGREDKVEVAACENDFNRHVSAKGLAVMAKAKVGELVTVYNDKNGTCSGVEFETDPFNYGMPGSSGKEHEEKWRKIVDGIDSYLDGYTIDYCGGKIPLAASCFSKFYALLDGFGFTGKCEVDVTGHDLREHAEPTKNDKGEVICAPALKLSCHQSAIGGLRGAPHQHVSVEFLQIGLSEYKDTKISYRCD